MKDYRLTIKVRNNRLLKAIEVVGGTPGGKWCAANGLGYSRVNDLVNMTSSPLTAEGELHRDAARLCEVLGKLPEDLWSNEQLYPLEKNFSDMNTLWAPKITLKSGKSWLYAHAIGFTRTEAKLNYLHSDRDTTDKRYGSKVTFVRVEVTELTPNAEIRGGEAVPLD